MGLDHTAIRKAYPDAVTIDDGLGAFDKDGNSISLEQSKINTARSELDAEAAKVKYKTDRTTDGSTTYDTIGNQLDMIYADLVAGKLDTTGTWATHINAVKDANPKP